MIARTGEVHYCCNSSKILRQYLISYFKYTYSGYSLKLNIKIIISALCLHCCWQRRWLSRWRSKQRSWSCSTWYSMELFLNIINTTHEEIKTLYIATSNTFWCPGAVVVIVMNADIASRAVIYAFDYHKLTYWTISNSYKMYFLSP